MSVTDIMNRQAVLDAIAECQLIGEEKLLKKYGFGRARSYWLVHEGETYSSKAIVGVAHGYARPDLGPLKAKDFNGGATTVMKKLEDLHFRVEVDRDRLSKTTFTSQNLQLDEIYTRRELRESFQITDATINTGVFCPKGTSSIWLFVTENKIVDHTPVLNSLKGGILQWQGQQSGKTDALIIGHQDQDLELLVFYRTEKYEHPGAGFRYLGEFVYVRHTASKPTSFVLERRGSTRAGSTTVDEGKKRTVFFHGINMTAYCGHEENIHAGGFKFATENGFGHEIFNFSDVSGSCYGYVEVTPRQGLPRAIDLRKLGASRSATTLDGVLVIWTAPCRDGRGREIVGWYRNATLHRELIQPAGKVKQERQFQHPFTGQALDLGYRVEARAADCFLLHPEQRVLRIPTYPRGTKGVPGQASVYYPFRQTSDEARELRERVLNFVNDSSMRTLKPRRPGTQRARASQDQERKKKIEKAAVEYVRGYFGSGSNGLGYEVESREAEGVGYDLLMTKGDMTLCVEVKGRSRDEVVAEFTRNESQTIQKAEKGRFEDGDYRVCIVTDALNEGGNRTLHHFSWWKEKNGWIKVDGSERLIFSPSGSTVGMLEP